MAEKSRHLVVLGSSTPQGSGASSPAASWVGLFEQHVRALAPRQRVTNLARGGYRPEQLLPSGDPARNITQALALGADLIIVNLPLGIDAGEHRSAEGFLAVYRELQRIAAQHGADLWFTTATPKNHVDDAARVLLREYCRRIKAEFAPRVIDFWTPTAAPDGRIRPELNADGIHLNDAGHRRLFEEAVRTSLLGEGAIPSPARVLFVGNSLTYAGNGVDVAFAKLAQAAGRTVVATRQVAGGLSLRQHLGRAATTDAIKARTADYVVVQGNSSEPIKQPAAFAQAARELVAMVRDHGATPVLYMTWTYKQDFREIAVADQAMTRALDHAYSDLGGELGATVVPAGLAYQRALDETAIPLYADTHHPNGAGAYLVGCTFLATLCRRSPVGLAWRGDPALSAADARALQAIAWETHLEYCRR